MEPSLTILVTVDTEGDDEWTFHRRPTSENVRHLRALEEALARVGARATYLVTYTVAEDPEAAETLRGFHEERDAEIGAHCHAWNTPPVREPDGAQLFLNELPGDAQGAKLANLTESIERRLGVRPLSFRGGRFGADANTMRCLRDLGYLVDSSVTPGVSWRRTPGLPGGEGGPDYRRAPIHTYFQDPDDPTIPGDSDLLEVPVTVVRSRRLPGAAERAVSAFGPAGLASSVANRLGLGRMLWFYPAFQSTEEVVLAAEVACSRGADVLNMMMHSSEVMPGGSPYAATTKDVSALIGRIEKALEVVMERTGAVPGTLSGCRTGREPAAAGGGTPC